MLITEDKIKILNEIGTKSCTILSKEYGVGHPMICDIKHKEVELREYSCNMNIRLSDLLIFY